MRRRRSTVVACLITVAATLTGFGAGENPKLEFWSVQRRGANQFNQNPDKAWFAAAAKLGLEWVRIAPDKWSAARRDFLVGDCDRFTALEETDLRRLLAVLDMAEARRVKVVLTMLSLPGCRWENLQDHRNDPRLWRDARYQAAAAEFWRQLAVRLRDHPAVAGYDLLNEPHPELAWGLRNAGDAGFAAWRAQNQGTAADLNVFYRTVIAAIRTVDPRTPIFVEGYAYGSVGGLAALEPIDDPAVLYSFHFYEPWQFTTRTVNAGRYAYPMRMATAWAAAGTPWTAADLSALFHPVADWAQRHRIPPNRIVAAEFGCARTVEGAQAYLADSVHALDDHGWHWAFYSYREDVWDEMDYELGTAPLPPGGSAAELRRDNPLFDVLKREFGGRRR